MAAGGGDREAGARPERFLPTRLSIDPSAFVAPGAVLVGEVTLGAAASVWYGCVLRGDLEPVHVGPRTNVQDLTLIHVDHGEPARIGADVTIGHRAVVHGCTIEDGALIGMGAVLLTGSRIGAGAVVAAGALVREGFEVPPGMVAAGVPARLLGPVGSALGARAARGVVTYVACAEGYREGTLGGGPHAGRR